MIFTSTYQSSLRATFKEVVLSTMPYSGGLYIPVEIPRIESHFSKSLRDRPYSELASEVLKIFLGDSLELPLLSDLCRNAYPFSPVLQQLEENTWVLELFHGPTLAFKDFGVRFMAQLLSHYQNSMKPLTILTATSGDTGGAVASAFHTLPGIEVFILFPKGKISLLQERQMTSLGDNIHAFPVEGNFDLCQKIVKEAFADKDIRSQRTLSSANSINLARLIPQICYYAYAISKLPDYSSIFSVPSGNFGNLTAGLMAKRMGFPVEQFVAATNQNDIVPRFLESREYLVKPFIETLSTAMDIADPSNFVRIQALYGNNFDNMKLDILGKSVNDESTKKAMRELKKLSYIADPHTAVAYEALKSAVPEKKDVNKIFLATAHPIKFQESVEEVLGEKLSVPGEVKKLLSGVPSTRVSLKGFQDLKEILV